MELRKRFVREFRTGLFTMSELCEHYTISRKTGYKWVARAEIRGEEGLGDGSRRPHHHPATTDPTVVEAILAARRRFPAWSGDTLVHWLARQQPGRRWPGRTRVCGQRLERLRPLAKIDVVPETEIEALFRLIGVPSEHERDARRVAVGQGLQ